MLKEYFYMFILYTDMGKKMKDILNSLFPGLIREPQRVRVPVQGQDEGRINRRQQKIQKYRRLCRGMRRSDSIWTEVHAPADAGGIFLNESQQTPETTDEGKESPVSLYRQSFYQETGRMRK